jgi:hypothetical protein
MWDKTRNIILAENMKRKIHKTKPYTEFYIIRLLYIIYNMIIYYYVHPSTWQMYLK